VSQQVSALARERIGGLQTIAAEPHQPRVTVVGPRWNPATADLRRFLARNQISFNWLSPDAPEVSRLFPETTLPNGNGPVWAVIPLMIIGGAFLCLEGVEKLAHKLLHSKAEDDAHRSEILRTLAGPNVDLIAFERNKIKGAVRTDFVLSAEIIVISLGTVAKEAFAVPRSIFSETEVSWGDSSSQQTSRREKRILSA
jgi:hypothetical protein